MAGSVPEQEQEAAGDPALIATVERLREERDGLRQAMSSRALIEQAKGMLMERHGCSSDQAFLRLARLSQHANIKLADVAAALVEVTASQPPSQPQPQPQPRPTGRPGPGSTGATPADVAASAREQLAHRWPRQGSGGGEFGARVRAQGRQTRIRAELLNARAPTDLIGTLVNTALGDRPPQAAALALIDVNGLMTMTGSHGIPGPLAARWGRLPVDLQLPVCVTARSRRSQWLTAARPTTRTEPLGFGLPDDWASAAILPLLADRRCLGVLAMVWTEPRPFTDPLQAELERVAASLAAVVERLPEPTSAPTFAPPTSGRPTSGRPTGTPLAAGPADPMLAVLDVLFHPVLLAEPVIEAESVVDLWLRHANPAAEAAAPSPGPVAGQRLLELWPDSAGNGLLAACRRVLRTGVPAELPDHRWRADPQRTALRAGSDLRVTRYRDGVLVTWNVNSHQERHPSPERPDRDRGDTDG
jgi:ANTAR domain/PAS fold